jgi:WD40 repeat protein
VRFSVGNVVTRYDRVFRVFVSSTFSDLVAERNALQQRVFPSLQQRCHEQGARFQAIDLRWGVSDEARLDQRTMDVCLQELRRCQVSAPPNYIVLLGDRYGWRPLPPRIIEAEFEQLRTHVSEPEWGLVAVWYRCDRNARPPEYVLQPRHGDEPWPEIEASLRRTLAAASRRAFVEEDPRLGKYVTSATHQEIVAGLLESPGAENHVFCYQREIPDLPQDAAARGYLDLTPDGVPDQEARKQMLILRETLRARLPAHQRYSWQAPWADRADPEALDRLCARVESDLWGVIARHLDRNEAVSELDREVAAHRDFGTERVRHFLGRESVRKCVDTHLSGDAAFPLVLHGPSGSGKTALMARLALDAASVGPVVVRFLGATPASAMLTSVLASICDEVRQTFGFAPVQGAADKFPDPPDLQKVRDWLKRFLARIPEDARLVIFLDALDQLGEKDSAQTQDWLPRHLPPRVKYVVSTAEEDDPAGNCLHAARKFLPPEAFVGLEPVSPAEGEALLASWLAEAGRDLTPEQRAEVLGKFAACPLPLYLKLAFEEARRWRSYDAALSLGADVPAVLDGLLRRLEINHGARFVERALGYLASARFGLSEDELIAVLSADEEFFTDYLRRAHHPPPENRLPTVVWARLWADLEPYLSERGSEGEATLMTFYHRQVAAAVAARYLGGESAAARHGALADFFAAGPDWFGALPNSRRAAELPFQFSQAGRHEDLSQLLCTLEFLQSKCAAGMGKDLERECLDAARAEVPLSLDLAGQRQFAQFIRQYTPSTAGFLQLAANEPVESAPARAARQALEAAGQPYQPSRDRRTRVSACLRAIRVRLGMIGACAASPDGRLVAALCARGLGIWDAVTGAEVAVLGHRPELGPELGSMGDGGWRRYGSGYAETFTGQPYCAFSKDSRSLLTGFRGESFSVWDVLARRERFRLLDSTTATHAEQDRCRCAVFSPDGQRLAVVVSRGGESEVARILDATIGAELATFPMGKFLGAVLCCAWSPDGCWIATTHRYPSYSASGGPPQGAVALWCVEDGKLTALSTCPDGPSQACAFSPDGSGLVVGLDDRLTVLAVPTLRERRRYSRQPPSQVGWPKEYSKWADEEFIPEGAPFSGGGSVLTCRFSPDGERLLASWGLAELCLWDVRSGKQLAALPDLAGTTGCDFLPDGKWILSGTSGLDSTVYLRLWNVDLAMATFERFRVWPRWRVRGCSFSTAWRLVVGVLFIAAGGWCCLGPLQWWLLGIALAGLGTLGVAARLALETSWITILPCPFCGYNALQFTTHSPYCPRCVIVDKSQS